MTGQSVILEVIRRHPDGIITSELARLTGATVVNAYDKGAPAPEPPKAVPITLDRWMVGA